MIFIIHKKFIGRKNFHVQGNIASNPEMLSLFLKLQGVISSRKLIDEDKKRIQDFYDAAKNGESHTRFQQYDSPK